ncbi:MAG: hypothetical protein ABIQ32_05525 [Sphingomicrobium sp.]
MKTNIGAAMAAILLLEACSSRPREFNPTLASAPAESAGFDAAMAECKQLYVNGKLDSNGRLASGAAGAAVGGATAVAGGAAAASAGMYAGAAVASATIILIPFVALGGAWGMARAKRHRKEKAIQTAMNGCLLERGYEVQGWAKAPKHSAAAPAAAAQ